MTDKNLEFPTGHDGATAPATMAKALSSEDEAFEPGATLWVGTKGDVHGVPLNAPKNASAVVFKNVEGPLPVRFRSVDVSAGTAADIVAIY